MWRALLDAGIPRPEVQVRFRQVSERFRVDFLFPGEQLIVEALGFEVHGTREAFEQDANRTALLTAMGYSVMPITWRMLDEDPQGTIAAIEGALRARRAA